MTFIRKKCWLLILLVSFSLPAVSQERGDKEIGVNASFIIDEDVSQWGLGASYKSFLADWMYLSGNTGLWFLKNLERDKIIPLTVGVGVTFDDFFQYYFCAGPYTRVGSSTTQVGFGINPGIRLCYTEGNIILSSRVAYHGIWVNGSKADYLEMGFGLAYVINW